MTADTVTAEQAADRKHRKRRMEVGLVKTARRSPQTLRVEVEYLARHRKYGKIIRRSTVLHVHDPKEEADVGDRVMVMECRPISKTKTWRLVRILERAPKD